MNLYIISFSVTNYQHTTTVLLFLRYVYGKVLTFDIVKKKSSFMSCLRRLSYLKVLVCNLWYTAFQEKSIHRITEMKRTEESQTESMYKWEFGIW